jgi:hypothetical protein
VSILSPLELAAVLESISIAVIHNYSGGGGLAVDNIFACCGFETHSSRRVGILASDMAYGVVRQGFEPGL